MDEKKVATVEIFGREYKVRGVADEGYIEQVAKYVDAKMQEITSGTGVSSGDKLAVLTALNIADELFQERERSSKTMSSIEDKTNSLIELLDANLQTED